MRAIWFFSAWLLLQNYPTFADGEAFSPELLTEGENHHININIAENSENGTSAELAFWVDRAGGVTVTLSNKRGFFTGERGRPVRAFYQELPPEEGRALISEIASLVPYHSNPERPGTGGVLITLTHANAGTGDITVLERPESVYDVEPLMGFLREFVNERSPGEIAVLAGEGFFRIPSEAEPGEVSTINMSPEDGYVDVVVNNAGGSFLLPARINLGGGVCKAKLDAWRFYHFVEGLRSKLELIAHPSSSPESPEVEIFLPMDDGVVEYSGQSKVTCIMKPSFDLMESVNWLTRFCVKEAYYPEFTKKGLEFKKELQRRKKKGED